MSKTVAVGVLTVLIAGGAAAIYYYTMPGGASSAGTLSSSSAVTSAQTGSSHSVGGWQNGYTPEGEWVSYLGYLPPGYVPAPHGSNAPTWPCPSGMSADACKAFQSTCGNNVCDPNESCATCPLDCAPSGEATCDPYTGRPGAPISVCFVGG